jgi:predicted methyltransferase
MRHFGLALIAAVTLAAPATAQTGIAAAVADTTRPTNEASADVLRKPAETLAFAGVKPGMIVGEFYPGGGYFTRMLSRIVGPTGHVYGIENAIWKESVVADEKLAADGGHANVIMTARPFGSVDFPRPLDLAWVTQNYHDLKIAEYGVVDTAAFNRSVYAALKPGGVFFILDHEAPAGTDTAGITKLHRIEKAQVIREVEAAGFKLAGEGKFLRRADDDHSLSIFDKKVQGHTDQYALRFVKPVK